MATASQEIQELRARIEALERSVARIEHKDGIEGKQCIQCNVPATHWITCEWAIDPPAIMYVCDTYPRCHSTAPAVISAPPKPDYGDDCATLFGGH